MNDLFFKEEHFMIQKMVRDFAKTKVEPVARELDEKEIFPKDLVAEMGELGLMGMMVPEKYGGSGLDMTSFATAIIELGKVDASVAITMAAHNSLGTLPLLLFGSEDQKNSHLPKLASGKTLGAFGLTEPDAGSDAGSTKTKAVREGNEYVVNGGKIFITNAGEAGLLSFTSQVIDQGDSIGIAAFIIPTPFFIIENSFSEIIYSFWAGTCKVMKSDCFNNFSTGEDFSKNSLDELSKKSSFILAVLVYKSENKTSIPVPIAILATSCPILPKPIIPKVFPFSSLPPA